MSQTTNTRGRRWGHWQKVKNDILYWLARGAMWLVSLLPLSWALRLGAAFGLLGWILARKERLKAEDNAGIAFPDLPTQQRKRLVQRCFRSLGRRAAEVCLFKRLELAEYVHIPAEDRCRIQDALAQHRGLLWVTAHFGNWELLALGLSAHGYDVRPIAKQSYDARFTDLIDFWRRYHRVRTLWRGRDDIGAGVEIALAQSAIVGLLIDQDTKTGGVFVPFFDRLAWTPRGAAELARRTGAPVLLGFIYPNASSGHTICVEAPSLQWSGDAEEDDIVNTAILTEAIERAIREVPEEWVWMHQRWKTRPVGELDSCEVKTIGGNT